MLGLALKLLLGAVAVGAAVAVVVYVAGEINRSTLRDKAHDNDIKNFVVKEIDRCHNVVTLEDMDSDKEVEVHGDGIESNLYEGEEIYA